MAESLQTNQTSSQITSKWQAKSIISTLAKVSIAVGLIYWMSQKGFLDLGQLMQNLQWFHYVMCFAICIIMIAFNNWRWSLLLREQDLPFRFFKVMPLTFIGLFFNFAVPGGVGGDVVKGYYLIKGKTEGRLRAVMTILLDRLIGLWAMAFLASLGFAFNFKWALESQTMTLLMSGVFAVFFAFCLLMVVSFFVKPERFEKMFGFLHKLPASDKFFSIYGTFQEYSRKPLLIVQAFVLSLASQSSAVIFIWYLGRMIEPGLDISTYFFVVPVGFMAMAVPIAPAGVGVGQAVLFFLFNLLLGHESQIGPNTMTSFQIVMFLWSLIGAYYYVRVGQLIGEVKSA